MHQQAITDLLNKNSDKLKNNGFNVLTVTEIQYAQKIQLKKSDKIIKLNIYFSKKKGFSFVFEGNVLDKHKNELLYIFEGKINPVKNMHTFTNYVGMDESGKGDYFGPLVASGFYVTREIKEDLIKLGVKDCKKLSDTKILDIYIKFQEKYSDYFISNICFPQKYNGKIVELKKQGKKLNALLGLLFAENIKKFSNKNYKIDGFLIDKFGDEKNVTQWLDSKVTIVTSTSGEDDIAVAAASVVARAEFIIAMQDFSDVLNIDIPFGASKKVDEIAKILYLQIGNDLKKYVKWHFKNTLRVTN